LKKRVIRNRSTRTTEEAMAAATESRRAAVSALEAQEEIEKRVANTPIQIKKILKLERCHLGGLNNPDSRLVGMQTTAFTKTIANLQKQKGKGSKRRTKKQ